MNATIEKLAREAGAWFEESEEPASVPSTWGLTSEGLERLAQAVAKRCGHVCIQLMLNHPDGPWHDDNMRKAAIECALAIAREFGIEPTGQKEG